MLILRPNCERCDKDLPADQAGAVICSFLNAPSVSTMPSDYRAVQIAVVTLPQTVKVCAIAAAIPSVHRESEQTS